MSLCPSLAGLSDLFLCWDIVPSCCTRRATFCHYKVWPEKGARHWPVLEPAVPRQYIAPVCEVPLCASSAGKRSPSVFPTPSSTLWAQPCRVSHRYCGPVSTQDLLYAGQQVTYEQDEHCHEHWLQAPQHTCCACDVRADPSLAPISSAWHESSTPTQPTCPHALHTTAPTTA